MYVIRPQFFITMITLLRNAALNSMKYKTELALVKAQNIDITNFEDELETFKSAFAKNFDLASKRFQTAIDEIDKSIDHLQKTKEALLGTCLLYTSLPSRDILIKLREINQLINNSEEINHFGKNKVIKFVYALGDDLFTDAIDRTKFFDFILPVIPVVNYSNSRQKLEDAIKKAFPAITFKPNFIDEVTQFLGDMRLLFNVVNEFIVYKKRLDAESLSLIHIYFILGRCIIKKYFSIKENIWQINVIPRNDYWR